MNRKILRVYAGLFCMMSILMYGDRSYPTSFVDSPIIHFDKIKYVFPTVFEGAVLTHTFVVSNRGTATLNIKRLTHS